MILAAAAAVEAFCQQTPYIRTHLSDIHIPAAAAGSTFFAESAPGLSEAPLTGLLLRADSRLGGERDRLSNLEVRLASGSVWSKRERFAVRRSVSSMFLR